IIATTIEENSGRCKTRPRLALNQSRRPRTANANGVVASATSAAVNVRTRSGSLASSTRYWAQKLVTFIVLPRVVQEDGNVHTWVLRSQRMVSKRHPGLGDHCAAR